MADIRHYRNDILVNPREFEEFLISMDWTGNEGQPTIKIDSLNFVGDEGTQLRERILSGLNGGVGFFEGEPYRIEVGPIGNPAASFQGYLDFTKNVNFIGCSEVEVSMQRKQGVDWLTDVADGFSYRFLESEGIITDNDFFSVPYVINYIPDGVQLLLLAISTFSLTKELIEGIKALSDRVSDLTDAATPVVGVSAGFGAGAVTAYDIGNIILAALKLIAQVAYLAAIVFALVELVKQIIEELMPPKRFHKAIGIRTLVQRACDYLNLKVDSSLLDLLDGIGTGVKWVIMPAKDHRGGERPTGRDASWRETGVPNQNDPFDTFGKVIRQLQTWFNAEYKIVDGTFRLERRDQFRTNSPYVIPDTFTEQDSFQDVSGFNTDEIAANYNINYAFDIQDQNTIDNQIGRLFQAQLTPKQTINADLLNLTGLVEVPIPCSLAVRKNRLTTVEEVVKAFAVLADTVTGQLGNPQSLSGNINNRIGSMHLSSHFTSISKLVAVRGKQLAQDQRSIVGAQGLWDNYHFINSFAPIGGIHNQYRLFRDQEIPFCFDDFVSLIDNNLVVTPDGKNAEIERLEWDVWNDKATISYKVNELYDNNFNITFL